MNKILLRRDDFDKEVCFLLQKFDDRMERADLPEAIADAVGLIVVECYKQLKDRFFPEVTKDV